MTPMLTVKEAAERLNVHPATVRRMILRGELPAKRVGRVYRVKAGDLEPDVEYLPGTPTIPARVYRQVY